ncbi:MAG: anion permease [Paracoccus sp. (in: a-proteobacteria)]|uniref:inorganic phosphate transporter n=1 Tax=Paracoccus sp. TaxID=267 RepID=UPI0026E0EA55|nr:inorganic phosphate transporter [Paracoccus sp. (in: a-proteobacteria)]MDO5621252.1 anion permease [Paracoccus sp. (in: a-proteobacteria)]
MKLPNGNYRILDKDLNRISNAAFASAAAAHPWLRLGAAVLFVATMALVAVGLFSDRPGLTTIAAGMALAAWLALGIGGNDVANTLGPAYGAGAISLGAGLVLAACAELAGAWFGARGVSTTLTQGVLPLDKLLIGTQPAQIMLAALLAAAVWISLCTWSRAPVSTTHAIVGGIAGAGAAAYGPQEINWGGLMQIGSGWLVSPLVSALLAAILMTVVQLRIHAAPDRYRAALYWLSGMVAVTMGSFGLLIGLSLGALQSCLLGLTLAATSGLWTAWRIARVPRSLPRKDALKQMLGPPLVMSVMLMAFAHGANDVANIAGPLAVLLQSAGIYGAAINIPSFVVALAGAGIALGVLLFGWRLVRMVGNGITRLNPVRSLCVTMASGLTVVAASSLAMPVSITHITVGGVFGVGLFREWDDRRRRKNHVTLPPEEMHRRHLVRRSFLFTVIAAWAVTVPVVASLSAVIFWLLSVL